MVLEMAEASQTAASPWQLESLEQRVHRLEDAVAAMQDTRLLEERVAQRVKERVNGNLSERPPSAAGIIIEAGRHLFPTTAESSGGELTYQQELGTPEPGPRPPWLLLEIYDELRAMYWMFIDPSYRLSWTGRLAPIAILFFLFSCWLFFGGFLWGLFDKIVGLLLIVLLYKVLSREASRYRRTASRFSPRLYR
jgi:hypothetical protein